MTFEDDQLVIFQAAFYEGLKIVCIELFKARAKVSAPEPGELVVWNKLGRRLDFDPNQKTRESHFANQIDLTPPGL